MTSFDQNANMSLAGTPPAMVHLLASVEKEEAIIDEIVESFVQHDPERLGNAVHALVSFRQGLVNHAVHCPQEISVTSARDG